MRAPPVVSLGSDALGASIRCTDCHVQGEAEVHVLMRTTSYNPFDETWSWGNVSMEGAVDVDAEARWNMSAQLPYQQLMPRACLPFLCVHAQLAGVSFTMGLVAELGVTASVASDMQTRLSYARSMKSVGSVGLHTRGKKILQSSLTSFEPEPLPAPTDSRRLGFEMDLDAAASVTLIPRLYAGIFTSIGRFASAEAYLKLESQLSLDSTFNFRTAIGAPSQPRVLAPRADCAAANVSAAADDDAARSAVALVGCSQQCLRNHDVHFGLGLRILVKAAYKFYVRAGLGPWRLAIGYSREVALSSTPFLDVSLKIGSVCFFLFPPSPSPPPPMMPSLGNSIFASPEKAAGAIIGISSGVVILLGVVIGSACFLVRKRRRRLSAHSKRAVATFTNHEVDVESRSPERGAQAAVEMAEATTSAESPLRSMSDAR